MSEIKKRVYIVMNDMEKPNEAHKRHFKKPTIQNKYKPFEKLNTEKLNTEKKEMENSYKKFRCLEKTKSNTFDIEQGYERADGFCIIGIDAWRDLSKCDCSSYDTKIYRSKEDVKKYYNLIDNETNMMIS